METTNETEKQVNRFDNLSLADLVNQITEIDKKSRELKTEKTCISDEILSRYQKETEEKLKAKPEPFGVVNVLAEGYKLSGNSVYGKSNSEYSFLYDPLYTLKTTLTGQLDLCMLTEFLIMKIPDIHILQINTDGLTVMFDKKYADLYFYQYCHSCKHNLIIIRIPFVLY